MKSIVASAFAFASCGYSPDRVVADAEINTIFLQRCRDLGLSDSAALLNHTLLNLRKQGLLRGLHSKRSSFADEDQYRFAAEIAVRFMERRDGITLDDIICDPILATEFDTIAARISPGFKSVQYRWAAFNLRKSRRLKPEILSRVVRTEAPETFRVLELDIEQISAKPGLYILFTGDRTLYIGEAENLRNRVRKHLDHSDNKGLARWLWEQGSHEVWLEIHVLSDGISTRIRRALESELISTRSPIFNVKR